MNVGSTKSYESERYNRRRLPKDYNFPLLPMKYSTKNERKYFDIGSRVTLFGLNNMEFSGKVGVIKELLEPSGRKDVILH